MTILNFENSRLDAEIIERESGAWILDRIEQHLSRFVAYPSEHTLVAHVLWIAHTHCMDAWESTPRIAFLSKEPGSGKSRALEVTEPMVPKPVEAVNVTPAYLFRKVGDPDGSPTILFDEIDTVFGPKAKDNEEVRGLLNAGHRRGAVAGRCVMQGNRVTTEEIPAYCAVALAGLGDLPDTILTRSVIVQMRRRAPDEHVEPYRRRIHAPIGARIGHQLTQWTASIRESLTDSWPQLPEGVNDRDADVWEPLVAVADAAGGDWPERARVAAVTLVTLLREARPSIGVQLLADLRTVFADRETMATEEILAKLHAIEESPWAEIKGKPLNSRGLANRLRGYGVKPSVIRFGAETARGYRNSDLMDAWGRYLPPSPEKCVTHVTDTGI